MVLDVDDNDGLFCPEVDVKHVGLGDVERWMTLNPSALIMMSRLMANVMER